MTLIKRLAEKRDKWRTWYLSWHETEPDDCAEIIFFTSAIADELQGIAAERSLLFGVAWLRGQVREGETNDAG